MGIHAKTPFDNMFRPAYELVAVYAWMFSVGVLLVMRPPYWWALVFFSLLIANKRLSAVIDLWRFRYSISVARMRVISIRDLIQRSRRMRKDKQMLALGMGFAWSRKHAEIAIDILNRGEDEIPKVPDWVTNTYAAIERRPAAERSIIHQAVMGVLKGVFPKDTRPIMDADIGLPWIHGIGVDDEREIGVPFSALPGHTLITGTTRAGKTRLYEAVTAQVVDTGSALIVIDPKKDNEWVGMLNAMCKATGRKFLYFDTAKPHKSVRLQPLKNFNNVSEAATRIGQLVDADGSFAAFAWKTLYRVHRALIAAGERPDIKNTKRYVQMGVEGLTEKILSVYLRNKNGPEWDRDLKGKPTSGKNAVTRLDWCIMKYTDDGYQDDTIDGMISMVKHSKEHFSKMIQVLEPILEMLGSDEIGDLLSPDPLDVSDTREIYDMKRVIDEKAVLYIGLDSLSNKIIASAIGSILLADLASTLGSIYNLDKPADAYMFVDEVAEVANDQLIQILNKGGGAGLKCFLAMQAIADLAVRLGSKDKAEQVLANLNNVISLRVRSEDTAEYVAGLFGEIKARSLDVSYSSGSESSASFTEFRSNTSRSLKSEKSMLVSPALLTRLPPLHFFALVAGRHIYKGCVEFIDAKRVAP